MLGFLRRPTIFHKSFQSLRKPKEKYVKKKPSAKPLKKLTKIRDKNMLAQRFSDFTDQDLFNPTTVRTQVKRRVNGMTKASQRHLWHGKVIRSKHTVSFAEKKTKVPMKPNLTLRYYYSEILQRNIRVQISVSLLRHIRFYGNFDNYILLSPPERMWSTFGEYLRLLMMRKLRDPSFCIKDKHVFGCEKKCHVSYKDIPYFKGSHYIPPAYRTSDLSRFRPNYLENYTRRQMRVLKAFFKGPEEFKKMEDEVRRIHMKEYDLEQEFLDQLDDLKEKHQKHLRKFMINQPKRYKMMARSMDDSAQEYIDPEDYPGKEEVSAAEKDKRMLDESESDHEVF